MNRCHQEQKSLSELQRQLDLKEQEVRRLRLELEEAKKLPSDIISSQERVAEAEAELEQLRQSFCENAEPVSWDHVPTGAATGPASDGGDTFRIYEDENGDNTNGNSIPDNEDAVAMGLELESARQAKEALFRASQTTSFTNNIQFADSPIRAASATRELPSAPNTFYHDLSKQLKAAVSRAEDAEVALQAMNLEVQSLGFGLPDDDARTCISNIKFQFRSLRLELE